MSRRFCEMCDQWFSTIRPDCPLCGDKLQKPAKLTRSEQEQGLADRGTDTHAERRDER